VNNAKESSSDQVQPNITTKEFEPRVGPFISDFGPTVPDYAYKALKVDPVVKLSRLDLSAFDMKHSHKSVKGSIIGRLQRGKSHIMSGVKGASVAQFPTVPDTIVHPNCNSENDLSGKTEFQPTQE
jgi:hypothetical protein